MRFNLSEWALRNRSLVLYFGLVLAAFGVWSYSHLGQSEDPPFTFKVMVVRTIWPGATAAEVSEQITERSSSPASDVYALGSVFYELLTSEKPFLGENPGAIVRAILEQQPVPPGSLRTAVPPELSALVLRMLDKAPANRPSSAAVVAAIEALETAA